MYTIIKYIYTFDFSKDVDLALHICSLFCVIFKSVIMR
jgi:hypothetical protein